MLPPSPADTLAKVAGLKVQLFDSLSATGKGHGTEQAGAVRAPPFGRRSPGMPGANQSGLSICLWQYSQSPLIVDPSLAVCESS
jgi:Serine dehydratase beta chain